jgi:hypothetical protein
MLAWRQNSELEKVCDVEQEIFVQVFRDQFFPEFADEHVQRSGDLAVSDKRVMLKYKKYIFKLIKKRLMLKLNLKYI